MNFWITAALVIASNFLCAASPGDRDPYFQQCSIDCKTSKCASSTEEHRPINYFLFPPWSCHDDCEYKCMHSISKQRVENGFPITKYHGHWPFKRLFGFGEPASMVFSVLNGIPHFIRIIDSKHSNQAPNYMTGWLKLYPVVALNAWMCSAIFHSRKTDETTMVDYISALVFLSFSLWLVVRRILGPTATPELIRVLFAAGALLILYRIHTMLTPPMDYGYHMTICITISVLQSILWLVWIFTHASKNKPHRWLCLACQVWFAAAAMLELFDFPPLFEYFDAHSLWHAATIPLGYLWYYFWDCDSRDLGGAESSTSMARNGRPKRAGQRAEGEKKPLTARDREAVERLSQEASVLTERGDDEILRDAFEDGSSLVCDKCGGLVKAARWSVHQSTWCPALPQSNSDGSGDQDDSD